MHTPHLDPNLQDAAVLRAKMSEWIGSLRTGGIAANSILSGGIHALVELALMEVGKAETVRWLRGQADLADSLGDELLEQLKARPSEN